MDQEQDRRPTDSEQPTKKQRLNRQPLPPLQNPNDIMNGLPANQVNQRMVDFELQNEREQQQAGKRRKRRTKRRTSKKSRKSRRKYRR